MHGMVNIFENPETQFGQAKNLLPNHMKIFPVLLGEIAIRHRLGAHLENPKSYPVHRSIFLIRIT
jgi:hypothetical protein